MFEDVKASLLEQEIRALEWFLQSGNWLTGLKTNVVYGNLCCELHFPQTWKDLYHDSVHWVWLPFSFVRIGSEIQTHCASKDFIPVGNIIGIDSCKIMVRSILRVPHNIMSVWDGLFSHGFNFNSAVKCYAAEALMFKQLYWSKSTVIDKNSLLLELGITHCQKAFIAGISCSCARGDSYTNLVSLSRHVVCSKSLFTWTFYHMELSTFSYRNLSTALYFQSENIARQTLFCLFLLWKYIKKRKKKRKKY